MAWSQVLLRLTFGPKWNQEWKPRRGSHSRYAGSPVLWPFPLFLSYLQKFWLGTVWITNNTLLTRPFFVCFLSGYWSITVYGRKHCYRLYTKHFNEAVHWACAIQKIIDTKAPVETPTQLLIRDIEVSHTALKHSHTPSRWQTTWDKSHQTQTAVGLHNIPPLFCYHGNHMTMLDQESKVSPACLSLLNEWPHLLPPQWDSTYSPEAQQPFQDKCLFMQSSEKLHPWNLKLCFLLLCSHLARPYF